MPAVHDFARYFSLLTVHTFASGSEGNALLISGGETHILVDAGISCRRIKQSMAQLGLGLADIAGILITHEHSDHMAGLATLTRQCGAPVYATAATGRQLCYRIAGLEPVLHQVAPGDVFHLGDVKVTVFPTSHDSADSVDYRLDGCGGSVGVMTDTGYVTDEAAQALAGAALLVLESNHDVDWLKSGPYPYVLKQRILGDRGHLSNDAAARFARQMAEGGTKQFVLAHLSRENNTPQRALETVRQAVAAFGAAVNVAPRGEVSRAYIAEDC